MVDQLNPGQIEALYVILRGMVGHGGEAGSTAVDEAARASEPSAKHRFSFIGIMDGEPDLAERSAQILREELGKPAA